ncbi:MAG: hypothetical protein ABJO27_03390 [Pseudoruegeria sp.]
MKKIAVLLALFFIVSAALYIMQEGQVVREIDISGSPYNVGQGVEIDWNRMCVSSEYRNPQEDVFPDDSNTCAYDGEIPERTVYFTYHLGKEVCETHIYRASFLFANNSETRCFNRDEIENSRVLYEQSIIHFGDEQ